LKKIARYSLRIAGTILCLLLLCWIGLVAYVQLNKNALLQKAKTQLSERLSGDIRIGGIDVSFFRYWPSVAIRLTTVSVRDSAWQNHQHDLLRAAVVDLTCDLWKSLRTFRIQTGSIDISHGQIYLYTDTAGYSNEYPLHVRGPGPGGPGSGPGEPGRQASSPSLPRITLDDMRFVQERLDKHKLFDLDVRHLSCTIDNQDRWLLLHIQAGNIRIGGLAFNTEKGSFLKDKSLSGNFTLQYNTASKILQFDGAKLLIDGVAFVLSGRLFPTVKPDPFFLQIATGNIGYRQATALLTPNLQQKLDEYDIDKPVAIKAQLDAGAADDPTPQIQVDMGLSNGNVSTPIGRFTGVSLKGHFINEWTHGRKRDDLNSGIRLVGFTGELLGLPLRSDTIAITNLKNPAMVCDLHSVFALEKLNELTGSQTLRFTGGRGNLNIVYNGPLSQDDSAGTVVNGYLDLDSTALLYLPYNFLLSDGSGRLTFKDQDLVVEQLGFRTGSSHIQVRGRARNLIALLDKNTENVSMDWNLASPHLDLEDLVVLAGRTRPATGAQTGGKLSATTTQNNGKLFGSSFARIDRLLKEGAIHVGIEAADLRFRKFSGTHARADLLFDNHSIRLNRLSIAQGDGSMQLKASLSRLAPGETSPLTLESHLEQVDLPRIFTAFDNFGQDAIESQNLKGRLTADVRMTGKLTGKAKIVPNSLKGTVSFKITDGELVDFSPMEKVKVGFLKKRDLSAIRFSGLENELDVDSTTVTIHRMEINSSAFTLYAEGMYDLRTGPDMSLQIPLRNLSDNSYQDIPPESRGNEGKAGPSIRLRAHRDEQGKLKISWDPFKKALKKKKTKSS
jgi:hypothetical protein